MHNADVLIISCFLIHLLVVPDGISVDWMSKQIYMTDASNDKIRRVGYNGQNMTNVISVGLREPRAIVVMPCERYLSAASPS